MGRKQLIIEELQDKLADAAWTIEVLESANANLSEKLAHETLLSSNVERRIDDLLEANSRLADRLEELVHGNGDDADPFTDRQRARFELYALVDHLVEEDELADGHHIHSVHADLLEMV